MKPNTPSSTKPEDHHAHPACESLQASISDKLDLEQPLSSHELQHARSCTDCSEFIDFLNNEQLAHIASTPMSEARDLTDSIMQRLHSSDKIISPAVSQWRRILSIGSLAAAAAVLISFSLKQQSGHDANSPSSSSHQALNTQNQQAIASLDEQLIKQNLQSQYQAISSVAGEKWSNVSTNIISAKEFVSEKTELFSQMILFRNEDAPQSMTEDHDSSKV